MAKSPFTGRRRNQRTSRRVQWADSVSHVLISVGGIGTILAVCGVFAFLVSVTVPLFRGADVEEAEASKAPAGAELLAAGEENPFAMGVGDMQLLAWRISANGELTVFRLDNGVICERRAVFEPGELTSASTPLEGNLFAFGTESGSVELSNLSFEPTFLRDESVPDEIRQELEELPIGKPVSYREGVILKTPRDQYRYQSLVIKPLGTVQISDRAIINLDHVSLSEGPLILAVPRVSDVQRSIAITTQCREKDDFMSGGKTISFDDPIELELPAGAPAPDFLALSGTGRDFYLAWKDGLYLRVHTDGLLAETFLAERGRLAEVGTELCLLEFALGGNTLVFGDSTGAMRAAFLVRLADLDDKSDLLADSRSDVAAYGLMMAKSLRELGALPTAMAASHRSRVITAGYANGTIEIYNVTTEALLGEFEIPDAGPVLRVVMSPKDDGLLVITESGTHSYTIELMHPEAALSALFTRVWYEGYKEPRHTWQSSSGHTGFEPKLGLIPLVVGTLKATFYSMLFGAPLAIMAAIFSAEFLSRKAKSVIKPTVELMASLPSVVLGFVAAQVIAPFVDEALSGSLALMLTTPLAFALLACLFQLLPTDTMMKLSRHRVAFFLPALGIGIWAARYIGPFFEDFLFAGDLKAWLSFSGRAGEEPFASALGGWVLLLFPLSACIAFVVSGRYISPWVRTRSESWTRNATAQFELFRFVFSALLVTAISFGLASLVTTLGFDPRTPVEIWGINLAPLGEYTQRNSLIVGFVMGFAIIPIIYTLADDALTAVPNHLRSAALGAGATPWQTAMKIVIPSAVSGILSALMVGLGRAVGETMIVLMATGNTPILEFNGFSGFRTLAANIAYEIPEAVRDSTHYRTLFLAALVLFVMTFLINTCAESVRLRFRKRADLL